MKFYHTSFLFPTPLAHTHLPYHSEKKDEKALVL